MAWRPGRVLRPELLDTLEPALAEPSLRDLVRINRWLGGHRILLQVLGELAAPREKFSLLDVGAASGDMARAVRRRFPNAWVVSLDRRLPHLAAAEPERVAADAFRLPFRERSFDFVYCSLFLHHFPDGRVVELISRLHSLASRALIAVDLERHPAAYYFLPASRWLFGWNSVTVHDGRISVESGFRPAELAALARAAGAGPVRIRKHRPWFRVSMVISA